MRIFSYTQFFFVSIVTIFFVAVPFSRVHAATLSFDAPVSASTLGVGDEFLIPVRISGDGVSINAVSGTILFSEDTLLFENIYSANSPVTSWVEPPHVSGNAVIFSGIMPGGYNSALNPLTHLSSPGILFTIAFKARTAGTGALSVDDLHVYKNDGLGTQTLVHAEPLALSFAAHGTGRTASIADANPPERFVPIVAQSSDVYDGHYVVVFSTTDKETGIDHYEVSEGGGDWIRAASPYLLQNQSTIERGVRVKAIDVAGNYIIESAGTPATLPKYIVYIVISALVLPFLAMYALYRRYHARLRNLTR